MITGNKRGFIYIHGNYIKAISRKLQCAYSEEFYDIQRVAMENIIKNMDSNMEKPGMML